ncbi:MAG TPA: hypothetical protein DGP25_01850 [Brevundimonas sp.]|nr:hypothetical protein [Brevundimonas sp.]
MTFVASSMPDRDWWSALFPDPEGLLQNMGVRHGMRVLDLCCGDGFFTASISKITDGEVTATTSTLTFSLAPGPKRRCEDEGPWAGSKPTP